ncbi:MAG: hypothetical protein AAF224_00315 [Pseudomonadota bacterium]
MDVGGAALVGATGFVGSNLRRQTSFAACYDSKSISDIRGRRFERVICAGAPAEMWRANQDPERDDAIIDGLIDNLCAVHCDELVLISTIAVLNDGAAGYTEDTAAYEKNSAYGRNRRRLEEACAKHFASTKIIRLPALFGTGLKKNFIFDILNPAPAFLKPEALGKLKAKASPAASGLMERYFQFDDALELFVQDKSAVDADTARSALNSAFESLDFSPTAFTNSQSEFQFYNLEWLNADIDRMRRSNVDTLHAASAPITAGDVYERLTCKAFPSVTSRPAIRKEMFCSRHASLWDQDSLYLYDHKTVLSALEAFYEQAKSIKE